MRFSARKTLKKFVESSGGAQDQGAVKTALDSWFHELRQADWNSPADVEHAYRNANSIGPDRVVFNTKGNDYRLAVAIRYLHREFGLPADVLIQSRRKGTKRLERAFAHRSRRPPCGIVMTDDFSRY
jgi:mRNA interferase HigB